MKSSCFVLVCAALAGCPKPTPVSPTDPAGPQAACLPAKTACVVNVDGVALIRTPTYWLLDVGNRDKLDVAALLDAAKPCDGDKGCGAALAASEGKALTARLAGAKIEQLPLKDGQVAAYRFEDQKSMFQIWGDIQTLARVLPQLSTVPVMGCPFCGLCVPAQCVLPPPVPPRLDEHIR